MLVVFLVEFVLTPYTIFVGHKSFEEENWVYDIIIDLFHVVNMLIIFCTVVLIDGKKEKSFSKIACLYIKSPVFWIDIIASWPTIITVYNIYWLYYFKLLRFVDYSRAKDIIARFGELILEGRTSKEDRLNMQYLV